MGVLSPAKEHRDARAPLLQDVSRGPRVARIPEDEQDDTLGRRLALLMDPQTTPGWSLDERLQAALFLLSEQEPSSSSAALDRMLRRAGSRLKRKNARPTHPLTSALIDGLAGTEASPPAALQKKEAAAALVSALSTLRPDDREFFLRVALLGEGTEKAARRTYGRTTERTQAWRIYRRLRVYLRRCLTSSR